MSDDFTEARCGLEDVLDPRLETLSQELVAHTAVRAAVIGATAFGIWVNVGAYIGAGWLIAAGLVEAAIQGLHRYPRLGERHLLKRALTLNVMFLAHAVWATFSMILWMTEDRILQVAAVFNLVCVLANAQAHAYRSKSAYFAAALCPTGAIVLLPWVSPSITVAERWALVMGSTVALAYLLRTAVFSIDKIRASEDELRDVASANRAKSAFLAMMSHEIRTPMNGVLGMAHALRETSMSEDQRAKVDTLIDSGNGLMLILNDILDFSKIEAGKLDIACAPFDILRVGRQVGTLWAAAAREKGVELTFEARDGEHWVMGDAGRVRQVLTNLVSNALKFTERGFVRVAIRSELDGATLIQVTDSGRGMDQEHLDKLFRAFVQGDARVNRQYGGTGLGLAISKHLVKLMGGEITASSEAGAGSSFSVRLRLPLAERVQPVGLTHEEIAVSQLVEEGADRPIRILVAEDNKTNQAVMRAILEPVGVELIFADDGAAAVNAATKSVFDAILMDINMPIMDGVEALRIIRSGGGANSTLPVIAVTADAVNGQVERLLGVGFDSVVPKPIVPQELLVALSSLDRAA